MNAQVVTTRRAPRRITQEPGQRPQDNLDTDIPIAEVLAQRAKEGASKRHGVWRSNYEESIGGADAADLSRRCAIALKETAVNRNSAKVPNAENLLSIAAIDRMREESHQVAAKAMKDERSDPSTGKRGAARIEAEAAAETAKLAVAASLAAQAKRAATEHAALVAPVQRHILRHAVVKDFFSAGDPDGPFPGARSAQGEYAAECYWNVTKEVRGGDTFETARKPQRHSVYGHRLTNHGHL